ncbi:MAG: UDP-glucose 4-epimerase [Verrucomicrobia bacterium]|nr:UDP-glucose 4-epimerase [Verrucomicrobiota bacterium]
MSDQPVHIRVVGITGGSGYLGSALARKLAGRYEVRILDREAPTFLNEHPSLAFRKCDVTSASECRAALEGVDAVFHRVGLMGNLASMKAPFDYYAVNLLGTLNVLEACVANRVKRFVFDSTVAVYGQKNEGPIHEGNRPAPNSIYGATKLACEAAIGMYDDQHGLSTLIFRYSRTRDSGKHDAITILSKKVLSGEPVTLYDGGEPVIDFVELEDVISANELALASSLRREVVNISCGEGISFAGMLAGVEKLTGRTAASVRFEQLPAHPPLSEHKFGSKKFFMSIDKARHRLGWTPVRSMESSIAGSIAALKGRGK